MPRLHVHLQDVDETDLIDDSEFDTLPQRTAPPRRATGGQRFGSAESLERKRSERRKQVRRGKRQ